MATLIVHTHEGTEIRYPLQAEEILIGKGEPSATTPQQLFLNDDTVSRRHARIYREGEVLYIEDLGSTNRTYLNDEPIKRAQLRHGDRIRIGLNLLILEAKQHPERSAKAVEAIEPDERDSDMTLEFNYGVLHEIGEEVTRASDLNSFAERVIRLVCQSLNIPHGLILLFDEHRGLRHKSWFGENIPFSQSVVEDALQQKQVVLRNTLREGDITATLHERGIQSVMCAPLLDREQRPLGVIYVEDFAVRKFGPRDVMLLGDVARHVAMGVERVMLNERIHQEQEARSSLERFLSRIQQSEETYRALLGAIPDLILHLDGEGAVLTAKLPRNQTPLAPEDPSGRFLEDILPEDTARMAKEHIHRALYDGTVQEFRFSVLRGDLPRHYEARLVACGKNEVLGIIRDVTERVEAETAREKLIRELQEALAKIKTLRGLIPICASCKKIRDDKGYWNHLELYLKEHSDAEFSHSMCPDCLKKWYPDHEGGGQ